MSMVESFGVVMGGSVCVLGVAEGFWLVFEVLVCFVTLVVVASFVVLVCGVVVVEVVVEAVVIVMDDGGLSWICFFLEPLVADDCFFFLLHLILNTDENVSDPSISEQFPVCVAFTELWSNIFLIADRNCWMSGLLLKPFFPRMQANRSSR